MWTGLGERLTRIWPCGAAAGTVCPSQSLPESLFASRHLSLSELSFMSLSLLRVTQWHPLQTTARRQCPFGSGLRLRRGWPIRVGRRGEDKAAAPPLLRIPCNGANVATGSTLQQGALKRSNRLPCAPAAAPLTISVRTREGAEHGLRGRQVGRGPAPAAARLRRGSAPTRRVSHTPSRPLSSRPLSESPALRVAHYQSRPLSESPSLRVSTSLSEFSTL